MLRAVVFDLDGVLRRFEPAHVAAIEHRHGIAVGSLEAFAFAEPLLWHVTTGRITWAEWLRRIGEHLGSPAAAAEWGAQPTSVDLDVLSIVDRVREFGLATAILTNGTDAVPDQLRELGLDRHVDAVFNSAEIGAVKPDPAVFRHVLDALGVAGDETFFTDDSAAKLPGAVAVGMHAHLFRGADGLRSALRDAGVDV